MSGVPNLRKSDLEKFWNAWMMVLDMHLIGNRKSAFIQQESPAKLN